MAQKRTTTLKDVEYTDLQDARKAKFRTKAPKKPKVSASTQSWISYAKRHNAWCDKVKVKAEEYREKLKIIDAARK